MGSKMNKSKMAPGAETCAYEVPDEVLLHILSFVSGWELIKHCRLVSTRWKYIVDSPSLWLKKCKSENISVPIYPLVPEGFKLNMPKIYMGKPFGRNLLRNWNGKDDLMYWGGKHNNANGIEVQGIECAGSEPLTSIPISGIEKCWATTYQPCIMTQKVSLREIGLTSDCVDIVKPPIEVSVWTAARYDCASEFQLCVRLCDKKNKTLREFKKKRNIPQWGDSTWCEIKHIFTDYPDGVASVSFEQRGNDSQFWRGHYGPKIAAPCVLILPYPASQVQQNT